MLAVGLAGLQFVAILIVVFSSYVTSERALLDHAQKLLSDVGNNAAGHSRGFLNPARGAAELAARLSENRILASEDANTLERFLFEQLLVAPQFSSLYFAGEDGSFVFVRRSEEIASFQTKIISKIGDTHLSHFVWRDKNFNIVKRSIDPTDQFDPRTRSWYDRAKETKSTIWTDPYIFFTAQQPGITLASPVNSPDGGIRGVVGVDIEISSISEFLSRLRIGQSGKALIINSNGDVIAHPNKELLKREAEDGTMKFANIRDFQDPVARTAFSNLGSGESLPDKEMTSKFEYDGQIYISTVMPMISRDLPWTIAVYVPEQDFVGGIRRSRTISIWIAVFTAVVTGIAGLALAHYIHRPVRAFAVRSALIAQGEIDPSEPMPTTYSELSHANTTLVQQIVARKKAEREYGQTFDLSSRGMAQVAPLTGSILKANAKFCEITAYNPSEVRKMRYADFIDPEDPARLNPEFFATNEEFASRHVVSFRRKDGETIIVAVNAILIRDQNGLPLHAVVTLDDITESTAKENQISRLNRDLFHLARGHTMGQMAAGLAHELNQPLAAIAQNTDTAKFIADSTPGNPPELHEILTEIEQQSLRAGEIIRALRGFVSKDNAEASRLDISELIEQAKRLIHSEAAEAGVTIMSDTANLPMVNANRIQIAQVIVNLLRNAVEAIGASDVEPRYVYVTGREIDDQLEITIEDTGPGISTGIELFTQFETTKPKGMGLGLSICRSMVEMNGGKLWHDATYSEGARFCFRLPLHHLPEIDNG